MIFSGEKEITAAYIGKKVVFAVYRGIRAVWQMGNFFTREGLLFVTKDNETFEVKEN